MKKILVISLFSLFACFGFNVNAASINVVTPTVLVSEADGIGKNYSVVLERINNEPTPTGQKTEKISLKGNKEGNFGSITFTEPGYYYYKIYLTDKNDKKVKYDSKVYDYTVQVTIEEGGVLKNTVVLKASGSNEKSTVASFVTSLKNKTIVKKKRTSTNPFTGDIIVKYFIVSVISIILILLIIIYIKNQRSDD